MIMTITNLFIFTLFVIIIVEAIILFIQYANNKNRNNSSDNLIEQHKSTVDKLQKARKEISELKEKLDILNAEKNSGNGSQYEQKYYHVCEVNEILEQKIAKLENDKKVLEHKLSELKRDKDELNMIIGNESDSKPPVTSNSDYPTSITPKSGVNEDSLPDDQQDSSQSSSHVSVSGEGVDDRNVSKENIQVDSFKGITMYASFPRLAGSSVYFSDLSENLADDSYFELKVSNELGKATFKPINFMKIRNYDEAMAAMRTEGAKPNVATTVLEIKPGEAHKEENDWIIDDFATIKLV